MNRKIQQFGLTLVIICIFCIWLIKITEAKSELSQSIQRHTLERISFGVNSKQIKQVEKQGIEAYLQSQLNPKSNAESSQLNNYLTSITSHNNQPLEAHQNLFTNNQKLKNLNLPVEQQIAIKNKNRKLLIQSRQAAMDAHLARSIYSPNQLEEVMVDFWFNHFNVFAGKGPVAFWVDDYENQIRANALGKFRDLLQITASHPAMLIYLDNNQSRVTTNPKTKKVVRKINENYARELLELHTLGIDGGYTQADIVALARIFTGWGVDLKDKNKDRSGFFFNQNRHDRGTKNFLGHTIENNGMAEGKKALDILATHPATARHISYKLAQYFVSDRPPASLVDKLAEKFTETDGEIKVMLNTLLHSSEFNDSQYYGQKFKTPYQFIISLIRMAEIEQVDLQRVRGMLSHLSMPVYMCNPPTGYKNTQSAWLNSQGMLQRIRFATAIANGRLNRADPVDYQQLKTNLRGLSSHTQETVARTPPRLRSALMLGSPEAMYR